jgi:hypothetical protein
MRTEGRMRLATPCEADAGFSNKNLYLENDLAAGAFGKTISQQLPFWWQIGAWLTF